MTDITELAQREKFEAWAMTKICISKSTLEGLRTAEGYRNTTLSGTDYNRMWAAWKAAGAELVEALEKAQQQVVPDGLVKAVEFYEQVKRENPPVETGAWKDTAPVIGISLVSIARRTSQLLRQLDYEPNAKSENPIEVLLFDAEKVASDINEMKKNRAAMLNGGKS